MQRVLSKDFTAQIYNPVKLRATFIRMHARMLILIGKIENSCYKYFYLLLIAT